MTVKVLGPLDAGGAKLSPRERAMLSALVLRMGAALEPAQLADAYWGDDAPSTWRQQVKTAINRIRGELGRDSVITTGGEYSLGLSTDAIDAVSIERLVSSARQHALHGDADRAGDHYERALALWRGRPYSELAAWDPGVVEAMRLTEIRSAAEEELLEARLSAGSHREVVPAAERLVREEPLREARWAILALALYRSDRQAEALATIRAARERFLDELGIELGDRLRVLETAILRQEPTLAASAVLWEASPDCPYPGLDAFDTADAELFFGRDAEIDALLARIVPGAIVAVAGPSGSGKSSILRAGLLPRLRAEHGGASLIEPGRSAAAELGLALERGASVIAIDQAEELLRSDARAVAAFCALARGHLDRGGTIVLTIRSDFLDDATRLPDIGAAVGAGVFVVPPLSADGLRAAVTKPAQHARLRLEPGLVEVVLRDAADRASTLPYVSHALRETWLRREGATLTVTGYEDSGGITGAIAQTAEKVFRSFDPGDQELCRTVLLRLVSRSGDGTTLRRRVAASSLRDSADRRRIIDALVDVRLVSVDDGAIVIAHEAVAAAWPRLDGWLEDDAVGARLMAWLSAAAADWQAEGRPDDALLRGGRLRATQEWIETTRPDLTDVERALVAASAARDEDELRTLERRSAAERRQNRRLRALLTGAGVLLVAAVALGGVAAVQAREAGAAALDRQIEAITAAATGLRSTERAMAALMAAEAYRRWPTDQRTRFALMATVVEAGSYLGSVPLDGAPERVGMWPIPGTDEIVTVEGQVNLRVRDLTTGVVVRDLRTDLPETDQSIRPWVRVSEDGSTVGVLQHYGRGSETLDDDAELMMFFDPSTGDALGEGVRVDGTVAETVEVSADGHRATWATQGEVIVVDRERGEVRRRVVTGPVTTGEQTIAASAFSPEGEIIVGIPDGAVLTLDPVTLEEVRRVSVPEGRFDTGLKVAEDGSVFGVGSVGIGALDPDGALLWERRFQRHWECSRIAVSSRWDTAACGDEVGMVQRWSLTTGDQIAPPFENETSGAGDLAFRSGTPDLLMLTAIAPVVGTLRVDGGGTVAEPMLDDWIPWNVPGGALDTDGGRVVLQAREDVIDDPFAQHSYRVWDLDSGAVTFRVPEDLASPPADPIFDVRFIDLDRLLGWQVAIDDETKEETWRAAVISLADGSVTYPDLPEAAYEFYPGSRGDHAYVTTQAGVIHTLDPRSFREVAAPIQLEREREPFTVLESPDGTKLLAQQWGPEQPPLRTMLYDAATGDLLAETRDAAHAAWITPDGTVYTADNYSVTRRAAEDLEPNGPVANAAGVQMLSGDDAGEILMSWGGRGEVGLFDVRSQRQLGGRIWASDVGTPVLLPDAGAILLPTRFGTATMSLEPDAHFAAACRIAGRDMTDAEWSTYLGDLGKRVDTCADVLG